MAKRPTGAEEPRRTAHSEGPSSDGAAPPGHGLRGLDELKSRLAAAADFRASRGRPFVVLSYAQSVDGSIAGPKRERVRLSGPESMQLTYTIRALCDTILVGIGTVLADDPSLTVKQVPGKSPQPIVLDTRLRTPGKAALLHRPDARPWLIHGPEALPSQAQALIAAGAEPVPCVTGDDGRIHLGSLMRWLADHSVNSVMIEGGARVITSFIRNRLADRVVITISPRLLGGLPVIDAAAADGGLDLRLGDAFYQTLGRDFILWARPQWAGP
jgi:3,4-dihydroxy 2-butanone 4-phosphate synthase/GTP cyclohydrolase II